MPAAPGTFGLSTETAFDADLARDRRHLIGECRQRAGHVVDRLGERRDLALGLHRQVLIEVAVGDGGHDLDDAADLLGEVGGHDVDVVGEVLPRAGDARHLRLTAEQTFGADLARHARDFGRERVELVHHRVDGVLQLEDLALDVDRDLARQVAARDRGGDFRDVSDLRREVGGEQVDVVGEVLPRATDAGHDRLTAEAAVGADLARHARDFGRERAQLLDHRVERVLEQEHLAADVDGDLLGEVAAGDGGRHFGDVAHLRGQVAGHEVDVIGEVLPRTRDALHLRLATELAFRADFARHARDFGRECVELVDHRVDGVLQLENLAFDVDRDLARRGRRARWPWRRPRCCGPAP